MKHNILGAAYGAIDIFAIAIEGAILFALIPAIKGMMSGARNCSMSLAPADNTTYCTGMTATETVLSALIPLALVLGLVYVIWHQVKGKS